MTLIRLTIRTTSLTFSSSSDLLSAQCLQYARRRQPRMPNRRYRKIERRPHETSVRGATAITARSGWANSPHSRRTKRASIREDRGPLRMFAATVGEVALTVALAQRLTVMMARRRARRRAPAEAGRREHVPPPRRSDGAGALDARVRSRRARRGTSAGG